MIRTALIVLSILQVLDVSKVQLGAAWELPPGSLPVAACVAVSLTCEPLVREIEQALCNRELRESAAQNDGSIAWEVDELQSGGKQEHRLPAACRTAEEHLSFPVH